MSSEIACLAASLISAGAAKSGNPCERLTALCFIASRVISRITDSVNCSALAEIMRREISAIFGSGEIMVLRLRGKRDGPTRNGPQVQRLCAVCPLAAGAEEG